MLNISEKIIAEHQGQPVIEYTLRQNADFSLAILNYGGIIQQIILPDRSGALANVVLSQPTFDPDNPGHLGAITGRVAGRIAGASFELAGQRYTLGANDGRHNLHGGPHGLDKRFWQVKKRADGLELGYASPDGEAGFPGAVEFNVRYLITGRYQLTIEMQARSDQATVINLTQHSYFDLSGQRNRQQQLQLASHYFAAIDRHKLPTGQLVPVSDTPFDFRRSKPVCQDLVQPHPQLALGQGYDHPFVLDSGQPWQARLFDPQSGRSLQLSTSESCCVLYSANHFARPGEAICLETQRMPNAINLPAYREQVISTPERPYHSRSCWQFGVGVSDEH